MDKLESGGIKKLECQTLPDITKSARCIQEELLGVADKHAGGGNDGHCLPQGVIRDDKPGEHREQYYEG